MLAKRENDMKKRIVLLIVAIIAIYIWGEVEKEEDIQSGIKDKLLRYHVIANSDSEEDQQVKLKVKQAVLDAIKEKLSPAKDAPQAIEIVESNKEYILKVANDVLTGEGVDYKARVEVASRYFPTKVYGDLVLPPGQYNGLIIELGNAQGKNWWCVLFPTLCFVEPEYGVLPEESKEKLSKVLTTEEYYAVIDDEDMQIKVESKIINKILNFTEGLKT